MANTDGQIILGLDIPKTVSQINADIKKLQNQLAQVKATEALDTNSTIKLINSQIATLQSQLKTIDIKANVNTTDAQKTGQKVGQEFNNGISQELNKSSNILNSFKKSLENMGMGSKEIDSVATKISNLGVQIESLNQTHTSGKKNILSVDIAGIDEYGQAIKLAQQYDFTTGKLIKSIDAVSTAQEKAGSATEVFIEKQKKAVTTLSNSLNKIYKEAIDQGSSKPIKNTDHLADLKNQYDLINNAISKVGNASKTSFIDEQNSVKTLITNLQILVKEYKNAETEATSLRSKDISTVKSQYSSKLDNLITKMKSSGTYTDGFQKGAENLRGILNNATNASELTSFLNGLDKLDAGYKRAKTSAEAFNKSQKVGIKLSGLESSITDLQRISPEIDKFETEIKGAKVTIQSLLTDLSKVNTSGDLSVVNEKWNAFTKAAKASGIAIKEVENNVSNTSNRIKDLSNSYQKIKNLQIRKNRLDSSVDTNKIAVLTQEIAKAKHEYENIFSSAKTDSNFNAAQWKEIKRAIDSATQSKIEYNNAKLADSLGKEKSHYSSILSGLKETLQENGLYTDELKQKLENLETELSNVSNKGDLSALKGNLKTVSGEIDKLIGDTNRVNKIQFSMDNGHGASEYQNRINSIITSLEKYGMETKEAQAITSSLQSTFDGMKGLSGQELVTQADKLEKEFKAVKASVEQAKLSYDKLMQPASKEKITSTLVKVQKLLSNNTKVTEAVKNEWQSYVNRLSSGSDIAVKEINDINIRLKETENNMHVMGKLGFSWSDKLKQAWEKFGGWGLATGTMMTLYNQLRQIPKEVYEIDTAMTNLYKVTDETSSKYNQFLDSASKSAHELGRSISSLVEQTANWAKLGFSLDEAEQLAKISSIYANVGEVDNDTAVSDMVTAMKAFNIEASDSITIVDKLNKLGNEYATSAAALGDGLSRSASAMATSGTNINKTLAMLTGGTEITQNASEFGNFLKIGSMRIRGMKGELESLGEEIDETVDSISKVQTQILNRTGGKVNIFDDMGNFRDYYDIMLDISKVYDDLNDPDKADLTEILFGKQRGNQGAALIQAFQSGQIQKALEATLNAEGSAMQEQERWLESMEAKAGQFEAAFQSLSSTVLDSDLLKWFVDFGTGSVQALDSIINKLGSLGTIGLGAGLFAGLRNVGGLKFREFYLLMFC